MKDKQKRWGLFGPLGVAITVTAFVAIVIMTIANATYSHGFEGDYHLEPTEQGMAQIKLRAGLLGKVNEMNGVSESEFIDAELQGLASRRITIGKDYWVVEGERFAYEEILVRQQGDQQFLVMTRPAGADDKEDALRIIDNDTLQLDSEFLMVRDHDKNER